jgi:hypothetical protein
VLTGDEAAKGSAPVAEEVDADGLPSGGCVEVVQRVADHRRADVCADRKRTKADEKKKKKKKNSSALYVCCERERERENRVRNTKQKRDRV